MLNPVLVKFGLSVNMDNVKKIAHTFELCVIDIDTVFMVDQISQSFLRWIHIGSLG